jgi:hypothetical protein
LTKGAESIEEARQERKLLEGEERLKIEYKGEA